MQKSRFLFKKAAFMRNKQPRKIKSRGHVTPKMSQGSAGRLRGRCDELRGRIRIIVALNVAFYHRKRIESDGIKSEASAS
jgi:hypothetical protein